MPLSFAAIRARLGNQYDRGYVGHDENKRYLHLIKRAERADAAEREAAKRNARELSERRRARRCLRKQLAAALGMC